MVQRIIKRIGFAGIYAILFGLISGLAGYFFVGETHGEGWQYLWIYTGLSGLITAYTFSKFLIEKKSNFDENRLLIISTIVALVSHWLHWYLSIIVVYIQVEIFGQYMYGTPTDPLEGLFAAVQLSFVSLLFFGWTAIPISIGLIFLTRWIIKRPLISGSTH